MQLHTGRCQLHIANVSNVSIASYFAVPRNHHNSTAPVELTEGRRSHRRTTVASHRFCCLSAQSASTRKIFHPRRCKHLPTGRRPFLNGIPLTTESELPMQIYWMTLSLDCSWNCETKDRFNIAKIQDNVNITARADHIQYYNKSLKLFKFIVTGRKVGYHPSTRSPSSRGHCATDVRTSPRGPSWSWTQLSTLPSFATLPSYST